MIASSSVLLSGPDSNHSWREIRGSRQEIRDLLSDGSSIDELFRTAIFPICISSNSAATAGAKSICDEYLEALKDEVADLSRIIANSGLPQRVRLILLHLPLGSKQQLAAAFDARLRGLLQ